MPESMFGPFQTSLIVTLLVSVPAAVAVTGRGSRAARAGPRHRGSAMLRAGASATRASRGKNRGTPVPPPE